MFSKCFAERHPFLHSTIIVVSILFVCMLIGVAFESIIVGENYLMGAACGLFFGILVTLVLVFSIVVST